MIAGAVWSTLAGRPSVVFGARCATRRSTRARWVCTCDEAQTRSFPARLASYVTREVKLTGSERPRLFKGEVIPDAARGVCCAPLIAARFRSCEPRLGVRDRRACGLPHEWS